MRTSNLTALSSLSLTESSQYEGPGLLCTTCKRGRDDNPYCSNPFHIDEQAEHVKMWESRLSFIQGRRVWLWPDGSFRPEEPPQDDGPRGLYVAKSKPWSRAT